MSSLGEEACVSHLWMHISRSQENDMEMGLNAQEMEKVHDIRPTAYYSKRNPGLFDPLKVGLQQIILVITSWCMPLKNDCFAVTKPCHQTSQQRKSFKEILLVLLVILTIV